MGLVDWLGGLKPLEVKGSLRSRLLNDPYYRLRSLEELQLAAKLGVRLDVNQATVDDWLRLPGVSIHQARSLVSLSQSGVQFHCIEDIAAALSLPVQRLRPLAAILQFCYYDAESAGEVLTLNLNTASVEALTRVPAVDLFLARAIVQGRQQGKYHSLAELQQRLALPGALTAELMHYFRF
ncbi:MAG: ComEA family DNA-binding protein [Oculatellaceae cyanobacterium Prado106]|jgi:DNA uptake protein ComE-like DNA-binding protein|nr:ComEA family DNA-binding protein [Oculatellaceae cyanobacterium Prado106]